MEHQRAPVAHLKGDCVFQVELEFRNVDFEEGEKPLEQG